MGKTFKTRRVTSRWLGDEYDSPGKRKRRILWAAYGGIGQLEMASKILTLMTTMPPIEISLETAGALEEAYGAVRKLRSSYLKDVEHAKTKPKEEF